MRPSPKLKISLGLQLYVHEFSVSIYIVLSVATIKHEIICFQPNFANEARKAR
jgi:hypothetical protein